MNFFYFLINVHDWSLTVRDKFSSLKAQISKIPSFNYIHFLPSSSKFQMCSLPFDNRTVNSLAISLTSAAYSLNSVTTI